MRITQSITIGRYQNYISMYFLNCEKWSLKINNELLEQIVVCTREESSALRRIVCTKKNRLRKSDKEKTTDEDVK